MAVSNSVDFALTAADLVREARAVIGIDASEEPLSAAELTQGLTALNMMLKTWQAAGVMCWTLTEGTITLVQSQASYVFGSGGDFTTVPLDITDMRITRSGTDLRMLEISREDYYGLPIKTTEGYPTQWFYDRQRTGGTLYVWPAPDATAGTLKFTYRRTVMDMDDGTNDIDLPQEWHEAIVYNLGVRFIPRYGPIDPVTAQAVSAMAATAYQAVKDFDIGEGEGSISILPDWSR